MTTASDLPPWIPQTTPGTGRTFWVAPTGDDLAGDGSIGNPWRTMGGALWRDLGAGDVVMVRPGTYTETLWIDKGGWNDGPGGLPDGQLTFRSEIPGQALIRPPEGAYSTVMVRADHVTIEGFDIVGGTGHGIDVESSAYTLIHNNVVHDSGGSGIQFNFSEFIVIDGNTTFGNAGTNGWHTSGISVYQNRNITGDTDTPGFRTIVRDNISYDNVTLPVVEGDHTDGNGIIIDDFQSTQTPGFPNYTFPTLVENNLAFGNGSKGIQVTWSDFVTVRGNTVAFNNVDDLNLGTWRGELSNAQSSNNTWIDNIAVTNPALNPHNTAIGNYSYGGYVNENVVWENNLTFNGTPGQPSFKTDGGNNAPLASDGNLLGVDPLFVNAAAFDFRLHPASPAWGLGWGGIWADDGAAPPEDAAEPPAEPPVAEDPPPEPPVADPPVAEDPPPPPAEPADPDEGEDPALAAVRAYWQGLADTGAISQEHAASVLELFAESTGGTLKTLDLGEGPSTVRVWAFENEHKTVLFMAAGGTPPGELSLDLASLDPDLRSLRSEGVENGQTYIAAPDPAAPGADGDLAFRLDTPFELLRLAFARTAEGEEEIALWSDAPRIDLSVPEEVTEPADAATDAPDTGSEPPDAATEPDDDGTGMAEEDPDESDGDSGFSFGPELAAGLALASLLFFFV
ncbi:MAG: right-handed parallel beta-helix repeat-containing protein [Rhodobacteraceae bacterium]|nr:right-handed parallel beta-helix repeat-containing protein [Paracoccaceae bacterium]